MIVTDALKGVRRLFLDTAPVIYYVEKNPHFFGVVDVIFDLIDQGDLTAVTSPITLAECLVYPFRQNNTKLQQDFSELIMNGYGTVCPSIDGRIGQTAAQLRASYNVALPDALQIACALEAGCDAFCSNDIQLKRITEIPMLILTELTI